MQRHLVEISCECSRFPTTLKYFVGVFGGNAQIATFNDCKNKHYVLFDRKTIIRITDKKRAPRYGNLCGFSNATIKLNLVKKTRIKIKLIKKKKTSEQTQCEMETKLDSVLQTSGLTSAVPTYRTAQITINSGTEFYRQICSYRKYESNYLWTRSTIYQRNGRLMDSDIRSIVLRPRKMHRIFYFFSHLSIIFF